MKAYEPGERWEARFDVCVYRRDGKRIAEVQTNEWLDIDESRARLIAESPERDELLRELLPVLSYFAAVGAGDYETEAEQLIHRIDATLRRSEGE